MTDFLTITDMSETDALNYMLNAIGEAPVASIATAKQADVVQAINLLKTSIAEVQRMKWTFNTEFGYQLQPAGQLVYTNPQSNLAETLNVFEVPANLASWRVNPGIAQQGALYTDVTIRQAQYFEDPSGTDNFPLVFYDRAKNREGLLASRYPYLGLDVVWYMPWSQMPGEAQLYATAHAARQLVERSVNAAEIGQFVKVDEAYAYRHLRRAWGIRDDYNMLRSVRAAYMYGWRPASNVGFIDQRGMTPGTFTQPVPVPTLTITPGTATASVSPNSGFSQSFTITTSAITGGLNVWVTPQLVLDGVYVVAAGSSPEGEMEIPAGTTGITLSVKGAVGSVAGVGSLTINLLNSDQSVEATAIITVTVT